MYGDALVYLRILGAKFWRTPEDTREGLLENLTPGLGMFHFMWEIQKAILSTWWGNSTTPGTLSSLKVTLGAHKVSMDGKSFNSCDDFLFAVVRVKVLEMYERKNQKDPMVIQPTEEDIERVIKAIFDSADDFNAAFLQAGLLYIEVNSSFNCSDSPAVLRLQWTAVKAADYFLFGDFIDAFTEAAGVVPTHRKE